MILLCASTLIFSCNFRNTTTQPNKINYQQAEDFIMHEENFRTKAYYCESHQLSIGYGSKARSKHEIIDKFEAHQRLTTYLSQNVYPSLKKLNLTDNQFIALASFDYNTNAVRNIIKDGKVQCNKILLYNKVRTKSKLTGNIIYHVSNGLVKRRQKEYQLCISKTAVNPHK
jgi:GH24 family phage-related lysozyme (muramidase)